MWKHILIYLLIFLMVGCSQTFTENKINKDNNNWTSNTELLLSLNQKENGYYGDFHDNIKFNPNIYETFYLLRIKEILDIREDSFLDANKNYLKNYNYSDSDLQELAHLYKVSVLLDSSPDNLDNFLRNKIDSKIKTLKAYKNLDAIIINDIYFLSSVNALISEQQRIELDQTLSKISNDIQNSNDTKILRVLYPLSILTEDDVIPLREGIDREISGRLKVLLNKEKNDFWEIFQLVYLLRNTSEIEKMKVQLITKLESKSILISDMSNMQLLYLLELFNMLDKNELNNKQEIIEVRMRNCQVLSGGYRELVKEILPTEFTYFGIYIYNSLDASSTKKDEILTTLFKELIGNVKSTPSNINWRHVYSYIQLSDNENNINILGKGLIELTPDNLNVDDISIDQKYYFFKTMKFYNLEIQVDKLAEFQKEW
ncbi:hypothetical protein [Paenibacillus medicaginis]|uniref:Lipoprotein n=1 Tax=Paenibacillus medicaginis TaxID=1470560 RepID=A0ABV5C255_9BACL